MTGTSLLDGDLPLDPVAFGAGATTALVGAVGWTVADVVLGVV